MTNFLFKILRYSGIPFFFREVIQRRKVTIVMMHDISPEAAGRAFDFWNKAYNIISFADYLEARETGKKLPPKSLLLTLDDGHKSNYRLLSLIEKHKVPVTVFLCPAIAGTNRHFWFLTKGIDPDSLKKLPDDQRLELLHGHGFDEKKEYEERQALSGKEIKEMQASPFIKFQSHTRFHPVLTQCSGQKANDEIKKSKKELEEKFGFNVYGFAYPNGNYSKREADIVCGAGYDYAVTTDAGYNSLDTDIFRLKRFSVNDSENMDEIVVKTSGLWGLVKKIFQ